MTMLADLIIWCWRWPKIEHRDVFRAKRHS
jgi:hypothetical protein